MINTETKFEKVELLVKNKINNSDMPSTTKIEFYYCTLILSGDYIIISIEQTVENGTIDNPQSETYNTNRVYNLSEIAAYKTFNIK